MISSVLSSPMPSSVHTSEAEVDSVARRLSGQAGGYRLGRSRDRHWGFSWPPAGSFVSAYGEDLMTADNISSPLPLIDNSAPSVTPYGGISPWAEYAYETFPNELAHASSCPAPLSNSPS